MAVGRGTFHCTLGPAGQSQDLLLHAAISATGIHWFQADDPSTDVSKLITDQGEHVTGLGQVVLTSLPASPQAAFYDVALVADANQYSLKISHPGTFGAPGFPPLQGLDLTITKKKSTSLKVTGSLQVDLLGEILTMDAVLDADGLRFVVADPPAFDPLTIEAIESLDFSQLRVGAPIPDDAGMQHRYDLEDQSTTELIDSAGGPAPLELMILTDNEITRNAHSLTIQPAENEADRKKKYIASINGPSSLIDACQETNEITIEAWIQPTKADQRGPARIISLSKDTSNRNFHLGHGPEKWSSDPGTMIGMRLRTDDDYVSDNGRVWGAGFQGEHDPIQSAAGSLDNSLQYVVATRKAEGALALYINGIKVATGHIDGTFANWDENYVLLLGNEAQDDRAWAGTYHRIALYNQAMSETAIQQAFFSFIQVQGEGTLAGFPAPLNGIMDASLTQEIRDNRASNILRLVLPAELEISKEWKVLDLTATWSISPQALLESESQSHHEVWGNPLGVTYHVDQNNEPSFVRDFQTDPITIGKSWVWEGTTLEIKAQTDQWVWNGNGHVQNIFLPSPQSGPIPAMPVWLENRLWLRLDHGPVSFPLVQSLRADTSTKGIANIKLGPAEVMAANWANLTKSQSAGNAPSGFETAMAMLQAGEHTQEVLAESGSRSMLFEGNWNLKDEFSLILAMAFAWKAESHFGNSFQIQGDLHREDYEGFLQLNAEGELLFAGDGAVLSEGILRISSLDNLLFTGDFEYLGDVFETDGDWNLYRSWSACQIYGPMALTLTEQGLQGEGPVNLEVSNFPVEEPWLHAFNGDLSLSGDWLGESWEWQAEHFGGELVFSATNDLVLMGNFRTGPIYDPVSGALLADSMLISPNPNDRQPIQAKLTTQLNQNGFTARISAKVPWEDAFGRIRMLEIPAFDMFQAPDDRNEILELIAMELQANASRLLAPHVGDAAEFRYFQNQNALHIGLTSAGGVHIEHPKVDLPALFKTDANIGLDSAAISLSQQDGLCSVNLDLSDLSLNYADLLEAFLLEVDSNADVLPGAVQMLRQRLAEVLPLTLADSLRAHYSFDAGNRYVDVVPGMRLRVEYQNYQFVHPSETNAGTGFIGSGIAFYNVVSKGNTVSFDSFAGRMQPALQGGYTVSGLFDLQGRSYSFYRLFYPNQTGEGWIGAERATTLVGANSLNDIHAATLAYLTQNKVPDDARWTVLNFRGKAVVVPEIEILRNEESVYVPVGATLRHVLSQLGKLPESGMIKEGSFNGLRIPPRRIVGEAYYRINLGMYQQDASNNDIFDFPLVKGDRIFY